MTITAGPDGNIWFSDPYANQIGNITPDGTVTEYAVPTPASFPAGITTGPDGNIWFTELGSGQIGEFVLNEGAGGAARVASPVVPARVFNSAPTVDAPLNRLRLDPANALFGQQPTVAAVDAIFGGTQLETSTPSQEQQEVVHASVPSHGHRGEKLVLADPTKLGDLASIDFLDVQGL